MADGPDYLAPADGFLALDRDAPATPRGKVTVIPFGLEASVTYGGGTGGGPAARIAASREVELFDDELWTQPADHLDIATLAEPALEGGVGAGLDLIERLVEAELGRGRFPLVLGGEHSVTIGAIRPFVRRHDELAILHFDAHADLRDGYLGEPNSHASAMRRLLDRPQVARIVSVGVRNVSAEEAAFLDAGDGRVEIHWAREKAGWDIDRILAPLRGRTVYLSFDLDGFDASLMPATGTPEPGGLMWADTLPILRAAAESCRIVGADIVELAPIPGFHAADFLAAKLAYKILSYVFCARARTA